MPPTNPTVISVNTSSGGIPKTPVDTGEVTHDGIVGDEHNNEKHRTPMQALCLFDIEDMEDLNNEGFELVPGTIGENITCRGLNVDTLQIGDRLTFSGGVLTEVTKKRNPCYVLDAIDPTIKKALIDRCGMYVKILTPGVIRPGETISVAKTHLA